MQIWAIGTVRNEVDLIRINVLHHLSQGVDRILLLDDGSSDGTRDVLSDLSRSHPVEWSSHSGPFAQDRLLSELARRAYERGAAWVVPVDADEFWCAPGSSLRQVLVGRPPAAFRVAVSTFIQQRQQRHATPAALLTMTRTVRAPGVPFRDAERLVEQDRIAYVEFEYPGKWIAPAHPLVRFGRGGHTISGVPDTGASRDVECLHAPLRALSVLESKADPIRPEREIHDYFGATWHLRRWRRLAWEGRLEDEWKANSYLAGALDVYGQRHDVIEDTRLCDLVRPWM